MYQSKIPRNYVISYLKKNLKHIIKILDLGSGQNNIENHITHINLNPKFTIIEYNHLSKQSSLQKKLVLIS